MLTQFKNKIDTTITDVFFRALIAKRFSYDENINPNNAIQNALDYGYDLLISENAFNEDILENGNYALELFEVADFFNIEINQG